MTATQSPMPISRRSFVQLTLLAATGSVLGSACGKPPSPTAVAEIVPPTQVPTAIPPTQVSTPVPPTAVPVPTQAPTQTSASAPASRASVLTILLETKSAIAQSDPTVVELMLTKEVSVIVSTVEKAGYKMITASASGQPLTGTTTTIKPDLRLSNANMDDFAGLVIPCMSSSDNVGLTTIPPEAVALIQKAAAQGKPIAAQVSSVEILGKAGVLKGKQFATGTSFAGLVPEGVYKGTGVVQDGKLITSGTCPYMAKVKGLPDGTPELADKFVSALKAAG